MKNPNFNEVKEIFGNLSKPDEKCYVARKQTNPLSCEKVFMGAIRVCRIHNCILDSNKKINN